MGKYINKSPIILQLSLLSGQITDTISILIETGFLIVVAQCLQILVFRDKKVPELLNKNTEWDMTENNFTLTLKYFI